MKILCWLTLFTFLFGSEVPAQNAGPKDIELTNIPVEGLLLNHGWKFHSGDNLNWAKIDFNDSSWHTIDPTEDIHELPEIPKSGVCWLRLHLHSGNSSRQMLSMLIQQSGASEIYLDDSLIYKFGTISEHTADVKAYDPLSEPLGLPKMTNGNHVLTIRYQLQPNIFYTTEFGNSNPLLWIKVMDSNSAIEFYRSKITLIEFLQLVPFGILLMMLILHMAFYVVYPKQKANLFFGVFACASIIAFIVQLVFFIYNHTVADKFYDGNVALLLLYLSDVALLTAIYYLLERKPDFSYRLIIILQVAAIVLNVSVYAWGWRVGSIVHLLIYLNIIRIAITSISKHKRGALIIAIGGIIAIVCFILFILPGPHQGDTFLEGQRLSKIIVYVIFILSLPASVSLILALDFAFANQSLQVKLIEISELSQKTINQEKEKQLILSAQKELLEKQVEERTSELKQSLENLQSTQKQLIQSEKMASLGEVTAGIAHEIQNPLNFVNNFSEVNKDMIDEATEEIDKGNIDEAKSILNDIKENSEKINHHGKRADAIVKGMLEHSRSSSGVKEPTDVNALCDEYLRLSYHGLRAKDKSFNAKFETDFDPSIPKVSMVPQDIGRVILNLINNAFYAVNERLRRAQPDSHYEPTVTVSTKKTGDKISISVKDNGNGIPESIKDKIFQPFFTTKPTGSGTGLGLSLSYDIVKAHGGELKVNSKEREGSAFIIQLPVV